MEEVVQLVWCVLKLGQEAGQQRVVFEMDLLNTPPEFVYNTDELKPKKIRQVSVSNKIFVSI